MGGVHRNRGSAEGGRGPVRLEFACLGLMVSPTHSFPGPERGDLGWPGEPWNRVGVWTLPGFMA